MRSGQEINDRERLRLEAVLNEMVVLGSGKPIVVGQTRRLSMPSAAVFSVFAWQPLLAKNVAVLFIPAAVIYRTDLGCEDMRAALAADVIASILRVGIPCRG